MKTLLFLSLICLAAANQSSRTSEASEEYVQPDYFADIENAGGQDLFLRLFFYLNIVGYLWYCSFISSVTFGWGDPQTEEDEFNYKTYRDLCVAGAYYELQFSTQTTGTDADAGEDASEGTEE